MCYHTLQAGQQPALPFEAQKICSGQEEAIKRSLETLRDYLAKKEEVVLAYLFGSQADGTAGLASDYDIGLLVRSLSWELQTRLAYEIGLLRRETKCNRSSPA